MIEQNFDSTLLRPRTPNRLATTNQINDLISAFSQIHDGAVDGGDGTPFVPYCELIANESGAGKYKVKVWAANNNLFNPTRAVQAADIRGTLMYADAVLVNLKENGKSTHALMDTDDANQIFYEARWDGLTSEAVPRAVFVCNGIGIKACEEE